MIYDHINKDFLEAFKYFLRQRLLQIKKKVNLERRKHLWILEQSLSTHKKQKIPLQESNIKGRRTKHNGIIGSE